MAVETLDTKLSMTSSTKSEKEMLSKPRITVSEGDVDGDTVGSDVDGKAVGAVGRSEGIAVVGYDVVGAGLVEGRGEKVGVAVGEGDGTGDSVGALFFVLEFITCCNNRGPSWLGCSIFAPRGDRLGTTDSV